MDVLASKCSTGCESGWTNYLEQSFSSASPSQKQRNGFNDKRRDSCDEHGENRGKEQVNDVAEEEEDLSMVSDASSGPPHFYEDSGYFNDDIQYQCIVPKGATFNKKSAKRHRNKEQGRRWANDEELPSFLDDTASSPLINFSMNNFAQTDNQAPMESVFDQYPQPKGFSSTHFQEGSQFQDHFGFLQFTPPANQLQQNYQWF